MRTRSLGPTEFNSRSDRKGGFSQENPPFGLVIWCGRTTDGNVLVKAR